MGLVAGLLVGEAAGQSTVTGSVEGSVTDVVGSRLSRVLVTIVPVTGGEGLSRQTGTNGRFVARSLAPGSYDIRFEAIGYSPVLVRNVTVVGGASNLVSVTLRAVSGAVVTVDTLFGGPPPGSAASTGVSGSTAGLMRWPTRTRALSELASLSSLFDDELGTGGLPGDFTVVVVDGMPFYRATHPGARSSLNQAPLFPGGVIADVAAAPFAADMEYPGATGGLIRGSSRMNVAGGARAGVSFSGGPGWTSTSVDGGSHGPTAFDADVALQSTGEGGTISLVADAVRHQTPIQARIGAPLATSLAGLDPDLLGALSAPSMETFTRYSGAVRFDAPTRSSDLFYLRGAGGYVERAFDGPALGGTNRAYSGGESAFDYSLVGGFVAEQSDDVTLEFRGSISGSRRTFDPTVSMSGWAGLGDMSHILGSISPAGSEASRLDLALLPMLHVESRSATMKFGASLRSTSHTLNRGTLSELYFPDAAAALTGDGYGEHVAATESAFSTGEIGLFGQVAGSFGSGFSGTAGGRIDYETIPRADVSLNSDWEALTGIQNTDLEAGFRRASIRTSLRWQPSAGGATVSLVAGAQQGDIDPWAIHELLTRDDQGSVTRHAGSGIAWPGNGVDGLGTTLPELTLFGPDFREPRTMAASATLSQPIGTTATLAITGALRRTDFLLRRRNLNVPVGPNAVDANGLAIYGTQAQNGTLITATSGAERRFSTLGDVWALDPDGWSKNSSVSASLTQNSATVDLMASYTYSKTTDNWVGASDWHLERAVDPGIPGVADWSEAPSDFDVPHRFVFAGAARISRAELAAVYRFRSGLPFTPRYRAGIDANGDGSVLNDVAFVPGDAQLAPLLEPWPCLEPQAGSFAQRNSCRGESVHGLDLRLSLRLGQVGGRAASLTVDALNVIEHMEGVRDEALLIVDPGVGIMTSPDGSTVTLPVIVNPDFGDVIYPNSRGTFLRIGLRIGS